MPKYYNEKMKESIAKYQKTHVQQVKFNFSREYDADILEKLDSVGNKQGYIKNLIRADIARAKSGKKEEEKKMKYQVNYTDPTTGANSPIDTITAPSGYTAEDYIRDCQQNADSDWCEMLARGTVTLDNVTEFHVKRDFWSLWGENVDGDTVITMAEVIDLARDWEKPVEDLLEQLDEI